MYATTEYYTDTYGGTGTPDLETASEIIDAITFYKIKNTTEFQDEKLARACCLIADGIVGYDGSGFTGFSLGDLSLSTDTGQIIINGYPVNQTAISLIRATGFMYTGVSL